METKPDTFKTNWLQVSGVVGIILSLLYYYMIKECNAFGYTCTSEQALLHSHIIIAQTIYFFLTSFLLLISSIKIRRQKKSWVYLFNIALFLIVISLFLPSNLFFPNSSNLPFRFSEHGLFGLAIGTAFFGSIDLFFLPIIGVILFYTGIIKTAFSIYE